VKAWEDTCGDSGAKGTPTLAVPGGKKFRLSPVAFKGPCKSSSINVQARHKDSGGLIFLANVLLTEFHVKIIRNLFGKTHLRLTMS